MYYWNEETISHFQFVSNYISKNEVLKQIQEFVEIDCQIEIGDTEEMLVNDLINQVYSSQV
jgi:hypothetical protein